MPKVSAVLVRLPSQDPRTRAMKRFSNSLTASSKCTPLFTMSSTSFSSRSLIIVCSRDRTSCELAAGQPAKGLDVLLSRFHDDVFRQGRHRWVLVPLDALEIVAHELFVEAGLRSARRVRVGRPEPRRIWRQRFVDQN